MNSLHWKIDLQNKEYHALCWLCKSFHDPEFVHCLVKQASDHLWLNITLLYMWCNVKPGGGLTSCQHSMPPPMRWRAASACTLVSFLLTGRLVAVYGLPTNSYESAWMHKMLLQRQQRYWLTLKWSPCPRKALILWTTSLKPQPMLASVETRAECPESLDTTPFIWLGDVIITHTLEHSALGGGKATETWDWIIFGLSRERLSKSRPIWLAAR